MAVVSIEEYSKALQRLKDSLGEFHKQSDQNLKEMLRDSVIQRFEFCAELSWKVSLKEVGIASQPPKIAIREMARAGLVTEVDKWFDFIEARNKSSHTYDEKIAAEVLAVIPDFILQADQLLSKLKNK